MIIDQKKTMQIFFSALIVWCLILLSACSGGSYSDNEYTPQEGKIDEPALSSSSTGMKHQPIDEKNDG